MESASQTVEDVTTNAPPRLPISLRDHKRSIAITWSVITLDSCILPFMFYYALKYGTHLSLRTVFAIWTSIFGFVTILQWFGRLYKLVKKDDNYRPLGAKRWHLDFFQISYYVGINLVTALIVAGSSAAHQPNVRLLSMPPSALIFQIGLQLILSVIGYHFSWRTPVRFSSLPAGAIIVPGVYTIIEDVMGVDGGGGKAYREALMRRYEASPLFRAMLAKVTWFWGIGAIVVSSVCTALIWTVEVDVGYGIGWLVPFAWAGIWTIITTKWVQKMLAEEKRDWVTKSRLAPSESLEVQDKERYKYSDGEVANFETA